MKQQFLDIIVVRRRPGSVTRPLPDGLDDFADHNLITFKSYQEALNDWALKELTGHYVNYRKQVSLDDQPLPESAFKLYAVCARTPRDLFKELRPEAVQAGVYLVRRGTDRITVVVAGELPLTERNALLHLFSAAADRIQYGQEQYRLLTPKLSTLVNDLFSQYRQEGLTMPYTMNDYCKEVARDVMDQLTPEERLRGLPLEQRLAGLPATEVLDHIPKDQIEAYLQRQRRGSPPARKKKTKSKK